MKNLTFIKTTAIIALIILSAINGWAQTTLSVGGETLSQHGYNSAGTAQPTEARDSVTTGSTTRYYVLPDATANPNYGGSAAPLTGTLTSSFTWNSNTPTGTAAIGTIGAAGSASYTHYRQITWAGAGTINLTVQETNVSGCAGLETSIPISVIAAPTLTYPVAGGTEDTCFSGTNGSLNIQSNKRFWVNFSSPLSGLNKSLQILADVTRDNSGSPQTIANDVQVTFTQTSATAGYFTLPATAEFDHYDRYTITLVSVSDRISRKGGLWNPASGNTTFTYNVYPVPSTGNIYHLPNM